MKLFLLLFVLCGSTYRILSSCSPSDREALIVVKSSLKEPYLGILDSWSPITDCCNKWYCASCDPDIGRVTYLVIQKSGRSDYMSGSISTAICKLDRLSSLILADW